MSRMSRTKRPPRNDGGSIKDEMQVFEGLIEGLRSDLQEDIRHSVDFAMARYRTSYVSDPENPCCAPMRRFAARVWANPRFTVDTGQQPGVSLALFGQHVVYCPFCGVKL